MAEKLTKRIADAAKVSGKLDYIWDMEVKGFGLVITPAGSKSFILNYRNRDNRSRRKTIGKYGQLTVEQAREIAKELCYRISKGEDPVSQEDTQRNQPTFADVAARFMKEHSGIRNRAATYRSNQQILNNILPPHFGRMKIRALERRDVVDFMSRNSHRPSGANRSIACLSSILSKAEIWDLRDRNSNPCFKIEKFP